MKFRKREPAHGSFALAYYPDYSLMTSSGAWNAPCARIYDMMVEKRISSVPEGRRCVINDGRNWGFATPESQDIITETSIRMADYYSELYIAYLVRKSQIPLFSYYLDSVNDVARTTNRWQYFTELPDAIVWLRGEGFSLPDLTDGDFPEPIEADEYLKD